MNLADKIVSVLVKDGVDRFFMVTGGGAMFLNDAVAKSSDAKATFMHHEQSCAMAAVAYARQTGNPCCCIVTTGCGVTNAMTGLLDAWQDSVPVIFISGAVGAQYTTQPHIATVHGDAKKVRHLGVQEANCQDIVTPYTKHYQFLTRLSGLGDGLRELYSGRPGPIWIEIPLDSQSTPASEHAYYNTPNLRPNRSYLSPWSAKMLHKRLKLARRPLILAGAGIRQGRAVKSFNDFIKKHHIPFVTTYGAVDIAQSRDVQQKNIGVVGIKGSRAGNFAMQNCDLLLVLGSSLSTPVVGYDLNKWVPEANVVIIDIDKEEHKKYGDFDQLFIEISINSFFREFDKKGMSFRDELNKWSAKTLAWKFNWKVSDEPRRSEGGHDFYKFMGALNNTLANEDEKYTVIGDAGSAYYVPSQMFEAPTHRLITPLAQAEMGATIPYMVGAAQAGVNVLGITGDGSFMTNLQELQVIEQLQLPVVLFVWNNDGYLSIRNTQENYFDNRLFGTNAESGLKISNIEKITKAFNLSYLCVSAEDDLKESMANVFQDLKQVRPLVVEVMCAPVQDVFPTIGAKEVNGDFISRRLEDMKPFIDRETFAKHMIIDMDPSSEE